MTHLSENDASGSGGGAANDTPRAQQLRLYRALAACADAAAQAIADHAPAQHPLWIALRRAVLMAAAALRRA